MWAILSAIPTKVWAVLGGLLLIVSAVMYVGHLNAKIGEVEATAKADKKASQEKYKGLHDDYVKLGNARDNLVSEHNYSISLLITRHKRELKDASTISIIEKEISNAKPKDDGNISNILSDTLDALRLLD